MEEKVVPGPLAVVDSIFILFISSVYLCTTKGYTGFQGILLGILIVIGFNILLRIKYVGTVILFLSSVTWAFGIFSLLPLEKLVNNSFPWKIGVFIILLLISLAFHFKPVDEKKDLTPEQAAALDSYNQAVKLAKIQREYQKKEQKLLKKQQKAREKEAKKNGTTVDKQNNVSGDVMPSPSVSANESYVEPASSVKHIKDMKICPVISKKIPEDGVYCIPFYTYCITYLDIISEKFLTNDSVKKIEGFSQQALDAACADSLMDNYYVFYPVGEDNVHNISLDGDEVVHTQIFADLAKDPIMCKYGSSLMTCDTFMSKVGLFFGNGFYFNPISNSSIEIYDEKLFELNSIKKHIINTSDEEESKDFRNLFYYDLKNHQIDYIPIQ